MYFRRGRERISRGGLHIQRCIAALSTQLCNQAAGSSEGSEDGAGAIMLGIMMCLGMRV